MTEERKQVVEKVYQLFHLNGAKTVTMNDVSGACGISKKTLYQYFPNKEALLEEVVNTTNERVYSTISNVQLQDHNAIQELFEIFTNIYKTLLSHDDVFLYQLIKYYPRIYEECVSASSDAILNFIANNLEKGIQEGVYLESIDQNVCSRYFLSTLRMVKTSELFQDTSLTIKELTYFALTIFINAITTEKGKILFQQLKSQYEN